MAFTGALTLRYNSCTRAADFVRYPRWHILLRMHMRRSQIQQRPDTRLFEIHNLPIVGCLTSPSLWFHSLLPHELDGHRTAPYGDHTAPSLKLPLGPFLQALAIQKGACYACTSSEMHGKSHHYNHVLAQLQLLSATQSRRMPSHGCLP